ncbi:MAG TPA: glycine zipper family protein [Gammaproteobacteria bacterium]
MKLRILARCAAITTTLAACASIPVGPTVAVMPGPGKPFDQFDIDNSVCKNFARQELGTNPNDVAREQVLSGAAAGAVLGAASGALMGHGHDSPVGEMAGAGMIVGSAVGANAANQSVLSLQRRYDIAYQQCMYAKGNQVPGYVTMRYLPPPPPRR